MAYNLKLDTPNGELDAPSRGLDRPGGEKGEGCVAYDSRAVAVTIAGAVIGGLAGYLFFTEEGRALRRRLEPALDDIARELSSFRHTVQKAADVAGESWKLLNEAIGDGGAQPTRYPVAH